MTFNDALAIYAVGGFYFGAQFALELRSEKFPWWFPPLMTSVVAIGWPSLVLLAVCSVILSTPARLRATAREIEVRWVRTHESPSYPVAIAAVAVAENGLSFPIIPQALRNMSDQQLNDLAAGETLTTGTLPRQQLGLPQTYVLVAPRDCEVRRVAVRVIGWRGTPPKVELAHHGICFLDRSTQPVALRLLSGEELRVTVTLDGDSDQSPPGGPSTPTPGGA